MLRKLMLWSALLCIVLVTVFAATSQEQPTFYIGVLDDEIGAIANGARLAVEEINNAGGVRGVDGVFYQLELLIEPTNFGANLDQAVLNLQEIGVIAVLGPSTSEEVLNGLTELQSLNVPVITAATDDTALTADTSGLLFRSRAVEVLAGQALARFIIEDFNLTEIITVQLDVASTAAVIGFRSAADDLGVTPGSALLRDAGDIEELSAELISADSDVIVAYGSPALAGTLYRDLREGGWQGLFAYNQAADTNFRGFVPFDQREGILSATTWAFTSVDAASVTFLNAFIRTFGELPGEVEAAAYDSIGLIANALTQPGSLRDNLQATVDFEGVQGVLNPSGLNDGELSSNVAITRLGSFGAPEVLARFRGDLRLPPDQPAPDLAVTSTPAPTPTLDGVVITIRNERQNVRSGPSLSYPILGQLVQGETARVIGTLPDNSWVIIDFRGQQGWLATYLLDVAGDLNTVPLLSPPPTATPGITPSPTRPLEADIVIDGAAAQPNPIVPGSPFNVSVTVRNTGSNPAGPFTLAATFPPSSLFLQSIVPGLAPGQSLLINLTGTFTNTGYYATSIIADANNQVPEGAAGEGNNNFVFSYVIDRTIRRNASQTLNLGETIDLEGDNIQGDANWNADGDLALDAIFGAKLGILSGLDLNLVHFDLVNPATINRDTIPRTELAIGTLIGIITSNGNRGVMRVDAISDTQISLTFKLYN